MSFQVTGVCFVNELILLFYLIHSSSSFLFKRLCGVHFFFFSILNRNIFCLLYHSLWNSNLFDFLMLHSFVWFVRFFIEMKWEKRVLIKLWKWEFLSLIISNENESHQSANFNCLTETLQTIHGFANTITFDSISLLKVTFQFIVRHLSQIFNIQITLLRPVQEHGQTVSTYISDTENRKRFILDNVESTPIRQTWRYNSFIKTSITCCTHMYTNELFITFFPFDEGHTSYYLIVSCVYTWNRSIRKFRLCKFITMWEFHKVK